MADQEEYAGMPRRRRHSDTDSWTKSVIIGLDPDLLPPDGSRPPSDSQNIVLQTPPGSTAISLPSRDGRSDNSPSSSGGNAHRLSSRRELGSPNGSQSGLQLQPPSPRSSGRTESSPRSPWSPGGGGSLPSVPEEEEEGRRLPPTDHRQSRAEKSLASTDDCSEDDDLCSEDEDCSEDQDCSQCSDDDEPDHKYDSFNAELEELRQRYRSMELGRKSKSAPPTPSAVHADTQKWKTASPAGYSSIVSRGSSSTLSQLPRRRGGSLSLSSRQHDRQPLTALTDEAGDSSDSTETVVPGGTSGRSSCRSSRSRSKGKEPEPAIRTLRIASRARHDPSTPEDGQPYEPTDIEDEVQVGEAQRGI
ncbi:hypothetical protein EHS25_004114 [Saitozyma podzolica]|uniref:Uncharacterized protein n=1 Tax=Saitozyma podzolica TaxID=1890683 RepID=A0A427YTJ1_9TREE|nr:hypothetical protein EHS25_004114 [Saitozyma podzolica]